MVEAGPGRARKPHYMHFVHQNYTWNVSWRVLYAKYAANFSQKRSNSRFSVNLMQGMQLIHKESVVEAKLAACFTSKGARYHMYVIAPPAPPIRPVQAVLMHIPSPKKNTSE